MLTDVEREKHKKDMQQWRRNKQPTLTDEEREKIRNTCKIGEETNSILQQMMKGKT